MNMASNYDVTISGHHMPLNETPMKLFCVRH